MRNYVIVGVIAGLTSALVLALIWRGVAPEPGPTFPAAAPLPPEWTMVDVYVPPRNPERRVKRPPTMPTTRPAAAEKLETIIPEVNLKEATIEQALEVVRKGTGVNMIVEWSKLEAAGVERSVAMPALNLRDVRGEAVLRAILQAYDTAQLGYVIRDEILTITTEDEISQNVETRLYDIRDLMVEAAKFTVVMEGPTTRPSRFWPNSAGGGTGSGSAIFASARARDPSAEEELFSDLKNMITTAIDRDSWVDNGGRQGAMTYFAGRLLVIHTPEAHQQLSNLLELLREEQLQDPVEVSK